MKNEKLSYLIQETKRRLLVRRGFKCEVCGKSINEYNCQLAHCIIKSKANIKKYGAYIVHHDNNLKLVCDLTCNSKVIANNYEENKIVEEIRGL